MSETHHSTEDDLRQHRLEKLERIRARGDEPFKYTFARTATVHDARAEFEALEAAAEDAATVQIPNSAL
ncbi:MAG TPA: hypothetical protein PK869_06660, partial [Candidatus Hydrogenedentes bacterium]|nr:hypothetical protein [Candidatus Hydrogenedentota bacterium]